MLFVGSDPDTAAKVELAIRLRWPLSQLFVAASFSNDVLQVVENEGPDMVLFQLHQQSPSIEGFIDEVRSFSDVPLVVMESGAGAGYHHPPASMATVWSSREDTRSLAAYLTEAGSYGVENLCKDTMDTG